MCRIRPKYKSIFSAYLSFLPKNIVSRSFFKKKRELKPLIFSWAMFKLFQDDKPA